MIEFGDKQAEEAMKEAEDFAVSRGCRQSLDDRLMYLDQYGSMSWTNRSHSRCVLYKDFAEHSFMFNLFLKDGNGCLGTTPFLVGGLIYHPGATEADNSLSVELTTSAEPHWSIHT